MEAFYFNSSIFFLGFALGWWAGRKHVQNPAYFSERLARIIEKVRK